MAYNEALAQRIRKILSAKKVPTEEKKMFGGLCFMVNDKMCCGLLFDKKQNTDMLMARIGEAKYKEVLSKPGAHPMDFTGRVMKGFVNIDPSGYKKDHELLEILNLCLKYNKIAPLSAKKNKKTRKSPQKT